MCDKCIIRCKYKIISEVQLSKSLFLSLCHPSVLAYFFISVFVSKFVLDDITKYWKYTVSIHLRFWLFFSAVGKGI